MSGQSGIERVRGRDGGWGGGGYGPDLCGAGTRPPSPSPLFSLYRSHSFLEGRLRTCGRRSLSGLRLFVPLFSRPWHAPSRRSSRPRGGHSDVSETHRSPGPVGGSEELLLLPRPLHQPRREVEQDSVGVLETGGHPLCVPVQARRRRRRRHEPRTRRSVLRRVL